MDSINASGMLHNPNQSIASSFGDQTNYLQFSNVGVQQYQDELLESNRALAYSGKNIQAISIGGQPQPINIQRTSLRKSSAHVSEHWNQQSRYDSNENQVSYRQGETHLLKIESNPSQKETFMNPQLTNALEQSIRESQVSSIQSNIKAPGNDNPIIGSQISNQNILTHQQSTIRQSRMSRNIQNQSIVNGSQMLNSQHSTRNQIQTHIQTQNINNNSRIQNSNHSNVLPDQPSLIRQTTVQGPQQSISKRTIVNSHMNSVQTSQVNQNNIEFMTHGNNSTVQQQSTHKQQIAYGGNSNISKRDSNIYQSQHSQQSQRFEQGSNINQSSKIINNEILKNSIHSQIGSGFRASQDQTQQINNKLAESIAHSIKSNKSINQNGINLHESKVEVFDLNNRSKMSNLSNNYQNNIPLSPRASGATNVIKTETHTSRIQQIPSNIIKSPRESMISKQSRQNQMRQSNIAIQNQIRQSQINNQLASAINQNLRNSTISQSIASGIRSQFNAIITPPPIQSQILKNQHIINVAPINQRSIISSQIFQNNTRTSQVNPGITSVKRTTTIIEETPIGPSPQLLIFQQFFIKIKQILGFDRSENKQQTILHLASFLNNSKFEYQQLVRQLQFNDINRQQSQQQINYLNHQRINLERELENLKNLLQSQTCKNQLIRQESNQSRVQFMSSLKSKQMQYQKIISNLETILNEKQQRSNLNRFKLQQNSRIKNQLAQKIMYMEQDFRNNLMQLDALKNQTQQSAVYWQNIAQNLQNNKNMLEQDVLNKELLIQNIQNQKQKMHIQMNNYISRISNLQCKQDQARNQISLLQNALANNQHSTHTTSIHETHHRQIIEHQTHISQLQRIVSNLEAITMERDNLIKMSNSLVNELQIKNAHIQELVMTYQAKISELNAKLHMSHSQFEQLKVTMQSHVSITVQNQIDQLKQDNNILLQKLSRMEIQRLQNRNKYNNDQIIKLKQHYENQLDRYKNMFENLRIKSQSDLRFQQNKYTQILTNFENQKIKYQQLFDQQKNRLLATEKSYSKLYHQHVGEKNLSSDQKQRNGRLQKQLNNSQLKNKSLQSLFFNLKQDYQRLQNVNRQIRSQKQRIETNQRTEITKIITDKSKGFDQQKNNLLSQLYDRQNKITNLLRQLQLKNKEIGDQRIRNISMNNQPFLNPINLNVEIQQKTQTIINLNSQIVALNSRLILLEKQLDQLNQYNIQLESTLKDREFQYYKQNYSLKVKIQELQVIISQLRSEIHKNSLHKHIQTSTTIVPSSNKITSFENLIISQKTIQQPVVNAVSRVEIQKAMTNFDTPSSVTKNQSIEKLKTASRINYTQVASNPIHTTNQTISRTLTAETAAPSYPNSQLTYAPIASVQAPMTSSSKRIVVNRSPTPPRQVEIRITPPKIQQIQPVPNYKTTTTNVKSVNKFTSRLQKPKIIENRPRMEIKVSKPSQNRQRSNSREIVHINNRSRQRSRSPIRLPLSPPARIDSHTIQTNGGLMTTNIRSPIVTTQTLSNIRSTPNLLTSQYKAEQMNNSISKQIVQKSFHQQQLRVSKLSSVQDNTFRPTVQSFVSQGSNGMMLMQKDTITNGACCNFKP